MSALPRPDWWRGRRVLVTGHTGFVGGWLSAWLAQMGAKVSGFALAPPTEPSFFARAKLAGRLAASTTGDVNDLAAVKRAVAGADPEVVFHLAAQPIVREAFRDPVGTFATNVMGTVNVLEACRAHAGIGRLVLYTTDKVYRNDQSGRAFTESDRLGGNEPYSASKAGAEWAIAAWWESYFRRARAHPSVAAVRAGNIVGGGDWGRDRLLPDAIRAFSEGRELVIRSPGSTRPWQHVIDCLRGTLALAERLDDADRGAEAIAWNLGPAAGEVHAVSEVASLAAKAWGEGAAWRHEADATIPESRALVLSSERAARDLGWRAAWGLERAVGESVAWYRAARDGGDLLALCARQIEANLADATKANA